MQATQKEIHSPHENYRVRNRWWFLAFTIICEFAYMYNSTSITTLQTPIEKEFNLNEFEYGQILTFENLPGLFAPLTAGFLADRFGSGLICILSLLTNYMGQFISTYAVANLNYWVLIVGRVFHLTGIQAVIICKNKMFKSWFTANELGKAASICMIFDSLAMVLCDIGYPNLYQSSQSLFLPFAVGSGLLLVTSAFGIFQVILHQRLVRISPESQTDVQSSFNASLKAIKTFPAIYWITMGYSVTAFLSFFCTKAFIMRYLQTQFNFLVGEAGIILAVAMVVSGVGCILAGIILDKYGRLPTAAVLGAALVTIGNAINIVLPQCDKCLVGGLPLTIMSLGSVITLILPFLITVRLIKGPSLGVALAFPMFLIASTMMVFPAMEGAISDHTFAESGYFWVFLLNTGIGVIAVLLGVAIFVIDSQGSKKLQSGISNTMRESLAIVTSVNDSDI